LGKGWQVGWRVASWVKGGKVKVKSEKIKVKGWEGKCKGKVCGEGKG